MDLKVQYLPVKDTFSGIDMNWSEFVKGDIYIDCVALIPYSRVFDFIKGEEMNPNAPCKFVRKLYRMNDGVDHRDSISNKYSM